MTTRAALALACALASAPALAVDDPAAMADRAPHAPASPPLAPLPPPDIVPHAVDTTVHDGAQVAGAIGGGLLGGVFGGAVAGSLFLVALAEMQARSGCVAEGCEGYGLMMFFYTPAVALGGGLAGVVVGALLGAWSGGTFVDVITAPPLTEDELGAH